MKLLVANEQVVKTPSPSPRRAWIEIACGWYADYDYDVALPTEGVD